MHLRRVPARTKRSEEHESDERASIHKGKRARVQVASQRSVQSWTASEGIFRPKIWGEPFPVDRQHLLRVSWTAAGSRLTWTAMCTRNG